MSSPMSTEIYQDYQKTFKEQGYVLVKNFIPKEVAYFLYEYLKFSIRASQISGCKESIDGDWLVEKSNVRRNDLTFESVVKYCLPKMEKITQLNLYPTYSYSRLYHSGNSMMEHTDRPSCEISATIKLSSSDNRYNWPIYMKDNQYMLDNGDAVVYLGHEIPHRRDICESPKGWTMGQTFIHYVDKKGNFTNHKYDGRTFFEKIYESDL